MVCVSPPSRAALSALALAVNGCGVLSGLGPSACDRSEESNPPVRYTEGTVQDGIYTSSAPDGELLYFPGGMRYAIVHKLGKLPTFFHFYLSFDRYGTRDGTLAEAAGNQAEIVEVNEEELVVVNGTCSDDWLLVVAGAGQEK